MMGIALRRRRLEEFNLLLGSHDVQLPLQGEDHDQVGKFVPKEVLMKNDRFGIGIAFIKLSSTQGKTRCIVPGRRQSVEWMNESYNINGDKKIEFVSLSRVVQYTVRVQWSRE